MTGYEASELVNPLDNLREWFFSVDPLSVDDEPENDMGIMIEITPVSDIDQKEALPTSLPGASFFGFMILLLPLMLLLIDQGRRFLFPCS